MLKSWGYGLNTFNLVFLKIWLFFWMVIDWCSIRKKIAVGFGVNFERKLQFYSSIFIFIFIFYKKKLFFFWKIHNLEIFQNRKWCPYVTDLIYLKNQKIKLIFYKRALLLSFMKYLIFVKTEFAHYILWWNKFCSFSKIVCIQLRARLIFIMNFCQIFVI